MSHLKNTLALSPSYYYPESIFSFLSLSRSSPSKTRPWQLARLHGSTSTQYESHSALLDTSDSIYTEPQCVSQPGLRISSAVITTRSHSVVNTLLVFIKSATAEFFFVDLLKGYFPLSLPGARSYQTQPPHLY